MCLLPVKEIPVCVKLSSLRHITPSSKECQLLDVKPEGIIDKIDQF